jgi:hypothetical protein
MEQNRKNEYKKDKEKMYEKIKNMSMYDIK